MSWSAGENPTRAVYGAVCRGFSLVSLVENELLLPNVDFPPSDRTKRKTQRSTTEQLPRDQIVEQYIVDLLSAATMNFHSDDFLKENHDFVLKLKIKSGDGE
jgi:hypothetical protein